MSIERDGLTNLDELVVRLREESPQFLIRDQDELTARVREQFLNNPEQVRQSSASNNSYIGDAFGAIMDASELVVDVGCAIVSGTCEIIGGIASAIADG